MNYTALARPYAQAVFEIAKTSQALVAWGKFQKDLTDLVQDPEIKALLDHPQVSRKILEEVFLISFGKDCWVEQQNFLKLLIQNRQLALAPEILKLFNQAIAEQNPKVLAEIESPFPIDSQELEKIRKSLSQEFKKEFELTCSIHPELIGGFKIKTDHWVMDGSLQTQLKELAKALTQQLSQA